MRKLYVQDQRDRSVPLADNGKDVLPKAEADKLPSVQGNDVPRRDEERRKLVRGLMQQGKLQTAEDFHDAAFIFQHGQQPDDYLLAHVLAVEAMARGDRTAIWISAATLDRYLQSIGQKQVFGTQYSDARYAFYLQHRDDKGLAEEMKNFNDTSETQEPYDQSLLPDATRHDFCVPDTEAQHAYVDAVNAGKQADIPRLSGCQR